MDSNDIDKAEVKIISNKLVTTGNGEIAKQHPTAR